MNNSRNRSVVEVREELMELENGRAVWVVLPDFQKELDSLKRTKEDYLNGDLSYQRLWEREDSKKEAVLADLEALETMLLKIEENPGIVIPYLDIIRKKKNGGFWKQSGADVLIAENCTEYFTDFTNAWSALMIRVDVDAEAKCTLSLRHRTFTV